MAKTKASGVHTGWGIVSLIIAIAAMFVVNSKSKQFAEDNKEVKKELAALKQQVRTLRDEVKVGDELSKIISGEIDLYVVRQKQQAAELKVKQYAHVNETVPGKEYIYGNPGAKISLIEYSDFECPYCKKFHKTPKQLVDASNGNVNWIYKHLPLDFHNPAAREEAHAAECVGEIGGNRKFWMFTDEMFKITKGNGQGTGKDLAVIAESFGIEPEAFNNCMASGKYQSKINSHIAEAKSANITGTPGTIVFNSSSKSAVVAKGAQPGSSLMKLIKSLVENEQDKSDKDQIGMN